MAVQYKDWKKILTPTTYTGDRNFSGSYDVPTWAVKTPPSISNPISLTPWVTPKVPVPSSTTPITPVNTNNTLGIKNYWTDTANLDKNKPTVPIMPIPGQTNTKAFNPNLFDETNYLGSGLTMQDFNNLPPDVITGIINEKVGDVNQQEAIRQQLDYINTNQRIEGYSKEQEANRLQQENLTNEIADIQSSQRLQAAAKQLWDFKQNMGFLGSWGRPVISQGSTDAMQWAITQAQTTFQQMKTIESNYSKLRGLQWESEAANYEENMARLADELKQNTDSVVLQTYLEYQRAEKNGYIDTPKKMFEFQQRMLNTIDTSVEWYNQVALKKLNSLNDLAKTYAINLNKQLEREQKIQDEFVKNSNTLDEKMSKARGYYVDWNWTPLKTTDGAAIEYKDDADKPVIDWSSGKVAYFNTDAAWNQVVEIKQLFKPELSQSEQLELLIKKEQLSKLQTDSGVDWKESGQTDVNGNVILYSPKNPSQQMTLDWWDPVTTTTTKWVPISDAIAAALEKCKTGAQCGKFVNDILEAAWVGRLISDSYTSKEKAIDKIWQAVSNDQIWAGSIFAYPVKGKDWKYTEYWHIGIVTGVNQDWTINIMDFNANNDEKKREVLNYNPDKVRKAGGAYSVPIISNETVETPTTKAPVDQVYQILTEAGQADWVAKKNAKTIAQSWKSLEQIKQEYPNKDDQYRIKDVTDNVSKVSASFDVSNNKMNAVMSVLRNPEASGKSIEVALKSFVSAIDNTAAMAWEVAQARDAWLSDIDAAQARLIKIGSGKVKDSIRQDIINTVDQFHKWIQWAYGDYYTVQQEALRSQYWDSRANKLDLYKRWTQPSTQSTWGISSDWK